MLSGVRERVVDSFAACSVNLRSSNLRRAQGSFGLIWGAEWAATVAVGVIAFRHGGAGAVGLVAVARMIPAALVAPFAATFADQARRESVLAWVGWVRALSLGAAAAVSAGGGPVFLVYLALVIATIAQTLFRPAHSALLPTLCATPTELTSANVVRGLLDSMATLVGPLTAALLLKASGPAAVLVAAAAASALAGVLVVGVRYEAPPRLTRARATSLLTKAVEGIRVIATDRTLTLLTGVTTLQTFTRGALSVFSVVVALKLLGTGAAGVGVLTAAVGAGAIVGSLAAAVLVGQGSLARWFGSGVALWGAPLAVIGLLAHLWSAILLLAIVGIGNALVDVGVFTLLARLTEDAVLARVYAAFEGIITLGVAAGAIAAPVLISALGIRGALVAIGVVAPAGVLACWRSLRVLDARVRVQDADVALLRQIPMIRPLPTVTIEQLATRLARAQIAAGVSVFEQGDQGDDFYVVERGRADVLCDGQRIGALESGEGFGEIALIRGGRRTASVRAKTALTLRTLNRSAFVTAVTGYSDSARVVESVITDHLSRAAPSPGPRQRDTSTAEDRQPGG
ncbi:MAG: cyclic nucleotide-binding domain-containing protein [Solirubrobacterales bacterium]|nr:cyclic nucleotide-binding domain-containing protein [Solirubrobacterales bacterium]